MTKVNVQKLKDLSAAQRFALTARPYSAQVSRLMSGG